MLIKKACALRNVLSDFAGLIAFVVLCLVSRKQLRVLRGFLDEAIYGLSDSAKAFAIILFTDIFVGYHSPEGWTVLLQGIAHHLGLPAQENFIMLFIATFQSFLRRSLNTGSSDISIACLHHR